ncbi:hypothetical protein MCB86_16765 [Pseudomonas sp. KSR10]|uniref:hypothetical protein n=1 Tax=Pseudomonas sp. KSR10 TaxID=2916654 RepID=UPI001EF99C5C|nr:hypothetical protein [Pseudomonas sp. KSR10]MCG6541727.1 hypothetical protein [Pseudomonas sp. KSR10]
MSSTTVTCPAWVSETPKTFYIGRVGEAIRQCREATDINASNEASQHAFGMIRAGLHLDALTGDEFERLWDLAINARQCRWLELRLPQQPYTCKPNSAAQEARA